MLAARSIIRLQTGCIHTSPVRRAKVQLCSLPEELLWDESGVFTRSSSDRRALMESSASSSEEKTPGVGMSLCLTADQQKQPSLADEDDGSVLLRDGRLHFHAGTFSSSSRTLASSLRFHLGLFFFFIAAWPRPLCSPQDMKDEEIADTDGQAPKAGTIAMMAIGAAAAAANLRRGRKDI